MYSAGVDFGGTSTKLALVSAGGRLLARRDVPAQPEAAPGALVALLAANLAEMAAHSGLPFPPPGGIGVCVAGIVDVPAGRIVTTGVLGMEGCDIRALTERTCGCPVAVESDSNAGALADLYFGCAMGAADVLYLSWGSGIGAGLVMGGRLLRSRRGAIGEIGHAPVDPDSPRHCYCGCRGCLEVEAGGRAIEARHAQAFGRRATVAEIAAGAPDDPACLATLQDAARHVGRALSSAVVLLNPEYVVLGGGVSLLLEIPAVREALDRELARCVPAFARQPLTVALSAFGSSAGVIGAALLPRHRLEEERRHDGPGF